MSARRSFPPILLRFARHCCTSRILHLEPVGRAARTVGGILALRDDALKPHFAGVGEDGRPVAFDMLVEPDAGAGLGHDRCERDAPAAFRGVGEDGLSGSGGGRAAQLLSSAAEAPAARLIGTDGAEEVNLAKGRP